VNQRTGAVIAFSGFVDLIAKITKKKPETNRE
jgi:hypothetical protein